MSDRRVRFIQRGGAGDEDEVLALVNRTVRVILPSGTPDTRHQILALALVDLLGRIFPHIDVVCNADAVAASELPPGAPPLRDRLEAARAHGREPKPATGDPVVTVMIGRADQEVADVHVDGGGWQSYVGAQPSRLPDDGSVLPIGPLIAACRAANQAFQLAVGDRLRQAGRRIETSYFSALTYEHSTDPFDDPKLESPERLDAVLVGAGSIGGAAVYLFARMPDLGGVLDLVDDDTLKDHNPDRAILATTELYKQNAVKVDVAHASLVHQSSLNVCPHQKRFELFVAEQPCKVPLPVVLSAVDSVASRREIQDAGPLEVIDAACGMDQISCSGHRTDQGPCIYCLHIENVLDSEQIKYRLIAQATGFAEAVVIPLLVEQAPLNEQHLRAIENHRRLHGDAVAEGAFDDYRGKTLETLYREKFLYGEALVTTEGGGQAAVPAPFITALAGFLLAGEALKACNDAYAAYRLGPVGQISTMYREDPWGSPSNALLLNPRRWPTHECLCQSPLRLRLMRARYGL